MLTRKMKDSGIEWIGEIPEDWEVRKLGNLSNLYTGNSIKDNEKDNYTDNLNSIPYIATKDVNDNHTINYKNGMYVKEDDLSFKIALKDSTLICIEGGSAGTKIAYLDQDVTFGNKLCAVYSEFVSNKYLYYYILSPCFNNSFNSRITGLIPGVTLSEMSKIEVVIPPATKQYKIVKALDGKVTKIAALQSETQQSIEELKKYKQSLITEVVTKGLDPNVEMKDSGLEWVGEIPIQWKNLRFGRIISINSELVNPSNYRELPQVSPDDIEQNGGKLFKFKTVKQSGVSSNNYYFFKNQILYSKIRPKLNKVAIAPFDGLCSADMYPIETSENVNFITYLMMSHSFLHQVSYLTADRVKMPKINRKELSSILIVLPSIEEQRQIVSYLDEQTSRIDKLIADKTKVIEELENYKKSLIYEYVTGKKEV